MNYNNDIMRLAVLGFRRHRWLRYGPWTELRWDDIPSNAHQAQFQLLAMFIGWCLFVFISNEIGRVKGNDHAGSVFGRIQSGLKLAGKLLGMEITLKGVQRWCTFYCMTGVKTNGRFLWAEFVSQIILVIFWRQTLTNSLLCPSGGFVSSEDHALIWFSRPNFP